MGRRMTVPMRMALLREGMDARDPGRQLALDGRVQTRSPRYVPCRSS
jgi:hypothetical protein